MSVVASLKDKLFSKRTPPLTYMQIALYHIRAKYMYRG